MNNVTIPATDSKSFSTSTVNDLAAAVLAVILASSIAGAVIFAFIRPDGLGLYCSLGIGAFTIDPLRRRFSRGDNSRHE